MRLNKNTRIVGKNVILVPYKKNHVARYHEWMQSEELRRLTGSEPLTIEEEYEMQKKWLEDEDKLTFIILDKNLFELTRRESDSMIGDTNLFFNDCDDIFSVEAEIMIAEPMDRGKKRGWESMILMLRYGIEKLKIIIYKVKITLDNVKSIQMFKKLKFIEISTSQIFQEVTLEKKVDEDWINWIKSQTLDAVFDESYNTE